MIFYQQILFREEFLVRKGKQYYPKTLEFLSSLPNPNQWGEDRYWWGLNYHCIEISFFKSSLLFQSCSDICVDSTEVVPVPWLWLTVILQEIEDGSSCLLGLAVSWGVNWCAQGAAPVKCWMTCGAHHFSQAGVKLSRPWDDAELIRISLMHSQGILISCKMQKLFREQI